MNYEKISLSEFIVKGIHLKYLVSDNPEAIIINKLRELKYDNIFMTLPQNTFYNFETYELFFYKKKALTIFAETHAIKIINNITNNALNEDKLDTLNLPNGLLPLVPNGQLIGRDKEYDLLEILLNKKRRSNIILVGEAGVGKTEIISHLNAKRNNSNIMAVDITNLIAGTEYRGSFEEKINEIIKFSIENNIVLFIDEVHTLYNLGLTEGGVSALDILKPHLSSGQLSLIGATTYSELNRIQQDTAFIRRFNIFKLLPLTKDTIKDNIHYLLLDFDIEYTDEAINYLLNEAISLYGEKKLIDKFLDMFDTVYSYCMLNEKTLISLGEVKKIEYIWKEEML